MTREELIKRLRLIENATFSIPNQNEKQKEAISWIIADLTTLIWELEEQQANEG